MSCTRTAPGAGLLVSLPLACAWYWRKQCAPLVSIRRKSLVKYTPLSRSRVRWIREEEFFIIDYKFQEIKSPCVRDARLREIALWDVRAPGRYRCNYIIPNASKRSITYNKGEADRSSPRAKRQSYRSSWS